MTEHTTRRIEIIGAVASILAALWYFARPPKNGAPGAPGAPGQAGAAGVGIGGAAGVAGAPGAAGIGLGGDAGAAGAAGGVGPAGAAATNPGGVLQLFIDLFSPGGPALPVKQTLATPPAQSLPKQYMAIENNGGAGGGAGADRGGGAGGGCGCGGGRRCTSRPPAAMYPDGGRSCLSSSVGTLAASIESCRPGNVAAQVENISSALKYSSILSRDSAGAIGAAIQELQSGSADLPPAGFQFLPYSVSRFGAA